LAVSRPSLTQLTEAASAILWAYTSPSLNRKTATADLKDALDQFGLVITTDTVSRIP
jgi:hypothetical protein